ncbi:MAG TPA: hypothetical protein VNN21_05165, partial [Dehalococcoidia bacterium]|nr:hypothetical protein [Dehalococcoidia bacterium]
MSRFSSALIVLALVAIALSSGRDAFAQSPDNPGKPDPAGLEEKHQRMVGLFEVKGVVFTDADEAKGRLVVGVENRGLATAVEQRLRALGIDPALVDVVETPPIEQLASLRDGVRPLQGGLQINFTNYLCTLGFNAVRDGVQGFVTNSHCTASQGGVEGTVYYQSLASTDPTPIGREAADPTYSSSKCPAGMTGKVCRWSDSAFVSHQNGVSASLGSIAKPSGIGSLTISDKFTITGEGNAGAGVTVNKVGRTTGWTRGVVSNTCVNVGVSGTNIVELCQNLVTSSSVIVSPGDSGSPVFTVASGNNVTLQGILWGGSTDGKMLVYSPMANIERELGALTTTASSSSASPPPPSGPQYGVAWGSHNTPASMTPGETVTANLTFQNTGTISWQPGGANPFNLAYHWKSGSCPGGGTVVWDGVRTAMPTTVDPGETVSGLAATVKAPSTTGAYCLVYDLVQEGVTWFSWQGAPTLNVNVTVAEPVASGSPYSVAWGSMTAPSSMAVGLKQTVDATFTNTSGSTWPAGGSNPVRLSYHWRSGACPGSGVAVWDGLRTLLPSNVTAGQTVSGLAAQVQAPASAGTYCLVFDLVQEGVTWFSWQGAATKAFTVSVVQPPEYGVAWGSHTV